MTSLTLIGIASVNPLHTKETTAWKFTSLSRCNFLGFQLHFSETEALSLQHVILIILSYISLTTQFNCLVEQGDKFQKTNMDFFPMTSG